MRAAVHPAAEPHEARAASPGGRAPIVLDTNVLLDLFLFHDPHTAALGAALEAGVLRFISTAVMREELRRVLDYPQLRPRLAAQRWAPEDVLAAFDGLAVLCDPAPKAPFTCKDADDQKFIDLAVAHRATLVSKDKAVLCMAKRLLTLGVQVQRSFPSL